ncbi:MAG: SHOCT domain-containing protein, partial [Gammaproteobacteria bacterium]
KRIDKAKKNVEGSFGIIDDFRDVHFDTGSRGGKSNMRGRIVTTGGVEVGESGRPDWVAIDVAKAALAFRDAQVPDEVRKEERKARAEAAKLTLERREMREEMARMRKELQELQEGGGARAAASSLEERLGRLQQLRDKGLIDEADFQRRKDEILREI